MNKPDRPHRIWTSAEFRNVFYNQYVCVLGDSIQRAIYKDFVKLYQLDEYLLPVELRAKGENSFMRDDLLRRSPRMTNGKEYEEIRCFQRDTNIFKFYFLTKVYSDYVESVVFEDFKRMAPDVLIVNSCVWDITRYGPEAISEYKISLERFFTRLCHDRVVPPTTEIIWLTTLPLGPEVKGGFIVDTVKFMDTSRLRLDILESNRWVAENVAQFYDINVLDLHYMLRDHQNEWREADGIHWNGYAHRYMTSAICEFVEYLNIRALREKSLKSKIAFSEGGDFPQPVIQGQGQADKNLNKDLIGPLRYRHSNHREFGSVANYREAASSHRPSFVRNVSAGRNVMMLSSQGASCIPPILPTSNDLILNQNAESAFNPTTFSGFEGRQFTRPFWAK